MFRSIPSLTPFPSEAYLCRRLADTKGQGAASMLSFIHPHPWRLTYSRSKWEYSWGTSFDTVSPFWHFLSLPTQPSYAFYCTHLHLSMFRPIIILRTFYGLIFPLSTHSLPHSFSTTHSHLICRCFVYQHFLFAPQPYVLLCHKQSGTFMNKIPEHCHTKVLKKSKK